MKPWEEWNNFILDFVKLYDYRKTFYAELKNFINPLVPDVHYKGLFKYVWPFSAH